jgi:hypothetical protein
MLVAVIIVGKGFPKIYILYIFNDFIHIFDNIIILFQSISISINKVLITDLKELKIYREFQTIASINLVRTAVISNVAPAGLTQIQTNRFNQKKLNNEWEV